MTAADPRPARDQLGPVRAGVPVVSVAPTAVFTGVGGRKPTTTIEWTAERLEPAEIALTLYIPDAYLDDAGFPVWESVRTEVAKAIGLTLDAAVLYGTNAPATGSRRTPEPGARSRWRRSSRRRRRRQEPADPSCSDGSST